MYPRWRPRVLSLKTRSHLGETAWRYQSASSFPPSFVNMPGWGAPSPRPAPAKAYPEIPARRGRGTSRPRCFPPMINVNGCRMLHRSDHTVFHAGIRVLHRAAHDVPAQNKRPSGNLTSARGKICHLCGCTAVPRRCCPHPSASQAHPLVRTTGLPVSRPPSGVKRTTRQRSHEALVRRTMGTASAHPSRRVWTRFARFDKLFHFENLPDAPRAHSMITPNSLASSQACTGVTFAPRSSSSPEKPRALRYHRSWESCPFRLGVAKNSACTRQQS